MTFRHGALDQFVTESASGMLMLDREMRILAASARWLADRGLSDAVRGRCIYDVLPKISEAWREAHRQGLAGATVRSDGDRFEHDGRVWWTQWELGPWTDADGAVGGIVISVNDITARVEAQEKADDLARQLAAAVAEAEEARRRAEDARCRAETAERRLKDAVDAMPVGFDLFDADDRLVAFNAATAAAVPGPVLEAARSGATFEHLARLVANFGDHEPAEVDRWLAGRLERHRNPNGPFEELTVLGRWLRIEERKTSDGGTVVVRSDITDIKQRERELHLKTALLEGVLSNLADGVIAFDGDRKLLVANATAQALFDAPSALLAAGASLDDLIRFFADRGDYGDADREEAVRMRIAALGASDPWSHTRRRRNGRVTEMRFMPLPDLGGILVLRDVTERADAEARLAERTELLEATLENMGEGIAVFDAERKLVLINATAADLFSLPAALARPGVSLDELNLFRAERGDAGDVDPEAFVRIRKDWFLSPKPFSRTRRLPDGRTVDGRYNPSPDGGAIFVFRDVTERALSEQRLAEKTAALEATFRNMAEGIVQFGPDLRLATRNDAAPRLLDAPDGTLRPGAAFEDFIRFRAARGDFGDVDVEPYVAYRTSLLRKREAWSETRRLRSGAVIDARCNPLPDGGALLVFQDVTERADAEARLAERTALLEAALRNMGEGILVYDADRRLLVANERVAQLLDAPAELFLSGASLDALNRFRAERGDFGDVDPDEAVSARIALFGEARPWIRRQRDRGGRVLEVRFNPTADGGGVIMVLDVSEAAAREAALRDKTEQLEAMFQSVGEGIMIFDADGALETFNEIAARLVDAPAGLLAPGASLEALVRFRAERGDYGDVDVEEAVRWRMNNFRAREPWRGSRRQPNGRLVETRVTHVPGGGAVFLLIDLTDLAEKTAALEATLQNMGEGLIVYDRAGVVVTANDLARQLIDAPRALFEPGATLPALVRFRAVRGDYGQEDVEEGVRSRMAVFHSGRPWRGARRHPDGRMIELRISPMPDGGAVFVFLDLTERENRERQLAEKTTLLETTLHNMGEGIAVYGPDRRLLLCNDSTANVIGVPPDLMRPGTAFADVLRMRAARGDYGDTDIEAYIRESEARFAAGMRWTRVRHGTGEIRGGTRGKDGPARSHPGQHDRGDRGVRVGLCAAAGQRAGAPAARRSGRSSRLRADGRRDRAPTRRERRARGSGPGRLRAEAGRRDPRRRRFPRDATLRRRPDPRHPVQRAAGRRRGLCVQGRHRTGRSEHAAPSHPVQYGGRRRRLRPRPQVADRQQARCGAVRITGGAEPARGPL